MNIETLIEILIEYYGQTAPPNTLQIAPLKESGFVYNYKH